MKSTSEILETQCIATVSRGAPNLQIWKTDALHPLPGREDLEFRLMMLGKARESCWLRRTFHDPRTTSTDFPYIITQNPQSAFPFHPKTLSQRKVSRSRTQIPSCKGTMGSADLPMLLVPPSCAFLTPHTTTWRVFHFTLQPAFIITWSLS